MNAHSIEMLESGLSRYKKKKNMFHLRGLYNITVNWIKGNNSAIKHQQGPNAPKLLFLIVQLNCIEPNSHCFIR
ncbi:unnamed protein product [Fusarium graminearum]|uniref:Chromosome 1, complete genome n=1 Tax=Gibberella zeae (strain ATCC MYA-4620 / CBS 123657 / FGSC 9075 / NRRL 31084 / PH-1) TaxID=229533 RepID=A0A098D1V0_GIBZE|nr:unnamed protein product [Fusarium graminearum]CZS75695.1 unnamed protein product [Fusarium graminearum]